MASTLLRPLGFGETLDGAFALYRGHFRPLFVTSLVVALPTPLAAALVPTAGAGEAVSLGGVAVFALVIGVATLLGWGALTWQTAQAVNGGAVEVGEGLQRGVGGLFRLLLAALLVYVAAMALVFPAALAVGALAALMGVFGGGGSIAVAAVFTLIAVGAILGALAAMFAVPAAVIVEGLGPVAAIRRSWALSRGARLRVLGLVLVAWLIVMLPTFGLYSLGAGAGAFTLSPDAVQSPLWRLVESSVGVLVGALTYPFMVGAMTLQYFDRRIRREGYDLEVATASLAPAS